MNRRDAYGVSSTKDLLGTSPYLTSSFPNLWEAGTPQVKVPFRAEMRPYSTTVRNSPSVAKLPSVANKINSTFWQSVDVVNAVGDNFTNSIINSVKGTYTLVAHPFDTAMNITKGAKYLYEHPGVIKKVVVRTWDNFENANVVNKAGMIGGATGNIATFFGGGPLVKGIQATGIVSKVVNTSSGLLSKVGLFGKSALSVKMDLTSSLSPVEHEFYSKAKLISNHSLYKPGMLDDLNASTFVGSRYKTYLLQDNMILYRGGSHEQPLGQFMSLEKPMSELQVRIDKAILPKWPGGGSSIVNSGYAVKIPKGTYIHIGEVAPTKGYFFRWY